MTVSIAAPGPRLRYKFVELSLVTDESLESAVNQWVAQGWLLERIQFVTSEASRRPVMAFVAFVREEQVQGGAHAVEEARDARDELADTAELVEF